MNALGMIDAAGTAGTLLVVLACLGTQLRRLDAAGPALPVANLAGSLPISASLVVNFNPASALMEAFRIAIGLFGIARWRRERRAAAACRRRSRSPWLTATSPAHCFCGHLHPIR